MTTQQTNTEPKIDIDLARQLLIAQAPQWAELPLAPVPSAGTDNVLFRLGNDKVMRIPHPWAASYLEKEQIHLPRFGEQLPLDVPKLLAMGRPGELYPYPWAICSWLEGEEASLENLQNLEQAAADLARFILALQAHDTTGGPPAGPGNFYRGIPLQERDPGTREALRALEDRLDTRPLLAAWEKALTAAPHPGPAKWLHGDLRPGNLLAYGGRLSAVIDFGGLGVGDPACDLQVAWNFFPAGAARELLREMLCKDDEAAWERGKGWALSISIIALPYYWDRNRNLAEISRRTINEILSLK